MKISELTHPLVTPEHLRRKAFTYLRQSSPEQVEKNTGSQAFQRNQFDVARAYGWPEESIEVIEDDLGVTGRSVGARIGWRGMPRRLLLMRCSRTESGQLPMNLLFAT